MELRVKQQELSVPSVLLDTFDEKPVDCDFVLPDYCPAMAAVLKCRLDPVIGGNQWSGDRLMVDGQVWIRVLYLDEKRNCVYSYETSQPFTSVFTVTGRTPQTAVQLTAVSDYVNCRATGPRRLDVHGSFRVQAQVTGETPYPALVGIGEDGIYTQTQSVRCSVPAAAAAKPFSVNETLEPEHGGAICRILRSEAVPVLSDCKVLLGKLIVKGELHIRTLYLCDEETGQTDVVTHEVPFSQMLDMEGLTEEWMADPELWLISHDLRIGEEEGMEHTLQLSAKLLLTVQCWRTAEAEVLTDAYSTRFPLHLERGTLTARRLQRLGCQTVTVRQTVDLPAEGSGGVLDVWCEAAVMGARREQEKQETEVRLQVCLLAVDAEGLVGYYERPADLTVELPAEGTEETDTLRVLRTEYTVSPERQLELRVELGVKRLCYEAQTVSPVSHVTGDETESFPPETAAVKVVFAEAGESLWGIARDCHTSVEAVMQENDLTADILSQDTMLLVPMC